LLAARLGDSDYCDAEFSVQRREIPHASLPVKK
jgi:hypothetical protein